MSHAALRFPLAAVVLLAGLLSGCATSRQDLWPQHFGVRPDEPAIKTDETVCSEYEKYTVYAQQLQEAYHSRASQNRGWIYVAGILGLGVAAASGGLAAATAAGVGTLALLAVSGGFSAAAFATIDNPDLAQLYTIAANRVDQALKDADSQRPAGADGKRGDQAACGRALLLLKAGVSDARTALELSRTNTAAGAIARASAQQKMLSEVIATAQAGDPTHVLLAADITDVKPAEQDQPNQSTSVTLRVENIRLDQVAQDDVTVLFGTRRIPLDAAAERISDNTYEVKFTAPAARPDATNKDYSPVLLVGKAKQRVGSQQGKKFTYLGE